MVLHLLQVDGSDLEPEDDDPQQTQDQCTVPVHHVLWTNQIHSNLTGETVMYTFKTKTNKTLDLLFISFKYICIYLKIFGAAWFTR